MNDVAKTGPVGTLRGWFAALFPRRGPPAPSQMEVAAAAALWEARDDIQVEVDWLESEANHGRLSHHVPDVLIRFLDGRRITLTQNNAPEGWTRILDHAVDAWTPKATLHACDGQVLDIGRSRTIAETWRAIVAERLALELCIVAASPDGVDGDDDLLVATLRAAVMSHPPEAVTDTYQARQRIGAVHATYSVQSPWSRLSGEWLVRTSTEHHSIRKPGRSASRDRYLPCETCVAMVSHPELGVATMRGVPVEEAVRRRRRMSVEEAFDAASAPDASGTASARPDASRILELVRRAVEIDPDLADAAGTPITPLVRRHLPELLAAHGRALRTATPSTRDSIDADLAEGLEVVRSAVEDGLGVSASADRDALRTQLAFLKARHPGTPVEVSTRTGPEMGRSPEGGMQKQGKESR